MAAKSKAPDVEEVLEDNESTNSDGKKKRKEKKQKKGEVVMTRDEAEFVLGISEMAPGDITADLQDRFTKAMQMAMMRSPNAATKARTKPNLFDVTVGRDPLLRERLDTGQLQEAVRTVSDSLPTDDVRADFFAALRGDAPESEDDTGTQTISLPEQPAPAPTPTTTPPSTETRTTPETPSRTKTTKKKEKEKSRWYHMPTGLRILKFFDKYIDSSSPDFLFRL